MGCGRSEGARHDGLPAPLDDLVIAVFHVVTVGPSVSHRPCREDHRGVEGDMSSHFMDKEADILWFRHTREHRGGCSSGLRHHGRLPAHRGVRAKDGAPTNQSARRRNGSGHRRWKYDELRKSPTSKMGEGTMRY